MTQISGVNNKVHGGVHGGEFLTGKMDFFTITTVVPMDQTNVDTPSSALYQPSSVVWTAPTVIDGHGVAQTYSTKAAYDDAYTKQQNLNKLLGVFSGRANPVAISVAVASATVAGLGSAYNGSTMAVATINIATEKSGLWFAAGQGNFGVAADDSNTYGYLFADALDGTVVVDLATPVLNDTSFDKAGANQNFAVARRVAL